MISSRVFHALGYHVPETHLVVFDRDRLVVESNASDITSFGGVRTLVPEDIDRLMASVARRPDGSYRAVALRVPSEGESLIGPFQLFGTRNDDPNDIVPHEHRRELRGLHVFSAWLNHSRIDPLHTMDIVAVPEGQPPQVRHYLFDFMATLGQRPHTSQARVGGTRAHLRTGHHDPQHRQPGSLRAFLDAGDLSGPAVGRSIRVRHVRSREVDAAVRRRAVRQPAAGRYVLGRQAGDGVQRRRHQGHRPGRAGTRTRRAERWIADRLIDRRDRIGRTYFDGVLPLDDFAVRGGELTFRDLAVQHRVVEPRAYRMDWWLFDNRAGKPSTQIGQSTLDRHVPARATGAPAAAT